MQGNAERKGQGRVLLPEAGAQTFIFFYFSFFPFSLISACRGEQVLMSGLAFARLLCTVTDSKLAECDEFSLSNGPFFTLPPKIQELDYGDNAGISVTPCKARSQTTNTSLKKP
jgi:hypothetical protein